MNPKVSIITVNFNHKYFPKFALEALDKAINPWPIEIIFVDNASTDLLSLNFLRNASKEKRITLIESKVNIGFGGGNNLGAQFATGEYILILNPDTQVRPDSIAKMVAYMDSNPNVGILGPRLEYSDGTVQDSCRRDMGFIDLVLKRTFLGKLPMFKKRVEAYTMVDFDHSKTQEVELITGACMMLKRSFFEQIKGFDNRYFLFMEDFDLCKKVRSAGRKIVYYPESIIDHYHKRLSGGNIFTLLTRRVFWFHVESAIKYFWKWRRG